MSDCLVIIPTYNEKENISEMIEVVMNQPSPFHLLVVDDGSPDGTASLVKEKMELYPDRIFIEERSGKLGLGTAYIHGFRWALKRNYEFIFEMDADFSHNPADLNKLYAACKEDGHDMAIGSRYVTGVNVVNWPMSRVMLSYFASHYVRFVTGMPINDTTAGFKCYRRSVLETIHLDGVRFMGYAFQIEMKFLTWKFGFKITEVPIIFTDRTRGESKMSGGIIKEAVLGVIQIKLSSLFTTYRRSMDATPDVMAS
ncbi:polyprenol monophosphomannose synthase [Roseivirga misakiensis]|uniref:Dolichyl-phosphate beta-D-mannosyltransferase n=1 Tax=Roseivirga misakiensis TaxID=1563681 RepID=A0A1E5SL46_9BACT|nr:polyprenol monophosphomannose synthase [Roseivirga misakiensis]OEJ99766.1 dolichyl-phosphate beta-D-mannosyltransferase [Roseivirga misakiensis]